MISIDQAIELAKNKENMSNGGSACFDFGDVVLVKYSDSLRYMKNGEHARSMEEEVMEGINHKADLGVNTPRHIALKRVIEGDYETCYVLQEKCKGTNCTNYSKYGVSFNELVESLKFVLNIPFSHYQKLISDGCLLFEMGYEAKNKNLFYDEDTGFWFIDFLGNDKNNPFDINDITKVFTALRYRIPKPLQIASIMKYDDKVSKEEQSTIDELKFAIKAKTLLAIKSVIPQFERYEKFFLLHESDAFKAYLVKEKITDKDLLKVTEEDYVVFDELYQTVLDGIIDKIVNKGDTFENIELNEIRNDSLLFNLQKFWQYHKDVSIDPSSFDDEYDYERAVSRDYLQKFIRNVITRLSLMPTNDHIQAFLKQAESYMASVPKTY